MSKVQTGNPFFAPESLPMRLAGKMGFAKLRWSLRRLHVPVSADALVLEVGSGGNPYPRSNVLLDAYEETRERHWEALIHDRPTVLSFGENLPFKDKAFDYVIAAHVLEHSPDPEKFLAELERVAHAGYIETPDAFMERINPYTDHRLEITSRSGRLLIRKKTNWVYDEDLVELYEQNNLRGKPGVAVSAKAVFTSQTMRENPEVFHTRYFWKDNINFTVVNPEVDATWPPPGSDTNTFTPQPDAKVKLRLLILSLIRRLFSQGDRNAKLDILPLMRCPKCHSEQLGRKTGEQIVCGGCNSHFQYNQNIFYLH